MKIVTKEIEKKLNKKHHLKTDFLLSFSMKKVSIGKLKLNLKTMFQILNHHNYKSLFLQTKPKSIAI